MKYLVTALLLGLFTTAFVSARSRQARHHGGDSHDDGEPIGIRSSRPYQNCQTLLYSCVRPALKYTAGQYRNVSESVVYVRDIGAQQVCSDVLEVAECAEEKLELEDCQILPQYIERRLSAGLQYVRRICDYNFDELEKHWNCILDESMLDVLPQCVSAARESAESCNPAPLVNCVVDMYAANGNCEAGASDFIRQYLTEGMEFAKVLSCRHRPRSLMRDIASLLKIK